MKASSLAAAAAAQGECEEMGSGSSAGGFFNLVSMEGDQDGAKNNEACIPFETPETAHLKLIKKIVDEDGTPITDPAQLAQFRLIGSGFAVPSGAALSAVSGDAGPDGVAADQDVAPGRYVLAENFTRDSAASLEGKRYFQAQSWQCADGDEPPANPKSSDGVNEVTIAAGERKTCVITNTMVKPRNHVEKFAFNPVEGTGNHVGSPVYLNDEGTGELKYYVRVFNDSYFPVDTGIVTDNFQLPEGLLPNGDVTVQFGRLVASKAPTGDDSAGEPNGSPAGSETALVMDDQSAGFTRVGGQTSYTYEEFSSERGVVLADSIKNLGPKPKPQSEEGTSPEGEGTGESAGEDAGGSDTPSDTNAQEPTGYADFLSTIPVKEDTTETTNGSTKFKDARENLKACAATEDLDGNIVAGSDESKGAVNKVSLENEYKGYVSPEAVVTRDNVACIPVVKTYPPKWQVSKAPAAPAEDGSKVGQTVTLTKVAATEDPKQPAGYRAVATYTVTATNVGEEATARPVISDAPQLPAGFTLGSIAYKKAGDSEFIVADANESVLRIPAAAETDKTDPLGTVSFEVQVTGFITDTAVKNAKWETTVGETAIDTVPGVGECVDKDGTLTPGTGFYNKVSIENDEDGEDNNDSCVPVVPPATRVLVEKRDASGRQLLAGAEFALYKAGEAPNFARGDVIASPLEALTAKNAEDLAPGSIPDDQDKDSTIGRFVTPLLQAGSYYWIQEIKSPAAEDNMPGYSLLPEPVLFRVTIGGTVVPVDSVGDPITNSCGAGALPGCVNLDDSFYFTAGRIDVHDPRMGELPKAGGIGHWALAGGSGALIALSLFSLFRAGTRRRTA